MPGPRLFRRRYIPDELVELKDDEILSIDEDIIITKWNALKPRADFCRGYSCYYLKEGYKVSRFIDESGGCVYIYCDIMLAEYDRAGDAYTFNDMLIDIVVRDGCVRVLDLDEAGEALERGLISAAAARSALSSADKLLRRIYAGGLDELTRHIKDLE